MKREVHPSHAKITKLALIIIALVVFTSWGLGFYVQEKLSNQQLVNILVLICIGFFAIFLLIFVLRAYICKCPVCKTWLFKQEKVEDGESRKFICHSCNTIWDSKVKLIIGGDWNFNQKALNDRYWSKSDIYQTVFCNNKLV